MTAAAGIFCECVVVEKEAQGLDGLFSSGQAGIAANVDPRTGAVGYLYPCPLSSCKPEESAGWLKLQLAGDVTRGQGCEYAKRQAVS